MARPLDGYPAAHGPQLVSVFPHKGPASYTQIVVVTDTGDKAQGSEAGLKYFDYMVGGLTDSGTFRVECIPINPSTQQVGAPARTYLLRWVVVATGVEVAALFNLGAEFVRLLGIGPK